MRPLEEQWGAYDGVSFAELRGAHAGKSIAVLGGGPSLLPDMTQIPMDSIRIGVNHHASLCVAVAYMAFLDSPARVPGLMARMDDHAGRRISPLLGCTDWDFSGVEFWDGGMTSTFATWVACYMGGDPVLLCGMDCYQTGPVYCHGGTMAPHPCHDYPLENHLGAWRLALVHCERSEVIQAVSGPLVEVFGRYDA